MLVQLQGREVWYLQLNEAVSRRLVELMQERGMTQYQLYMRSGVPKSTIGNLVNCAYVHLIGCTVGRKLVMLSGVGRRVLVNRNIFHHRASISFLWGFSGAP